MWKHSLLAAALVGAVAASAYAQQAAKVDDAKALAVLKAGFPNAPADWAGRLVQDETMKACTEHRNLPSKAISDAIIAREKATIKYPPDGKLIGDWKKGEKIAQSGYGLRFTDYPAKKDMGGK